MKQSRRMSGMESVANVAIGIAVSFLFTWLALPLWGLEPSWSAASGITLAYTVLSLIRSYIVRRVFNAL